VISIGERKNVRFEQNNVDRPFGKDPEVRYSNGGDPVATISLATSENWTDKRGEKQERTEWHNLVIWGKLA